MIKYLSEFHWLIHGSRWRTKKRTTPRGRAHLKTTAMHTGTVGKMCVFRVLVGKTLKKILRFQKLWGKLFAHPWGA